MTAPTDLLDLPPVDDLLARLDTLSPAWPDRPAAQEDLELTPAARAAYAAALTAYDEATQRAQDVLGQRAGVWADTLAALDARLGGACADAALHRRAFEFAVMDDGGLMDARGVIGTYATLLRAARQANGTLPPARARHVDVDDLTARLTEAIGALPLPPGARLRDVPAAARPALLRQITAYERALNRAVLAQGLTIATVRRALERRLRAASDGLSREAQDTLLEACGWADVTQMIAHPHAAQSVTAAYLDRLAVLTG